MKITRVGSHFIKFAVISSCLGFQSYALAEVTKVSGQMRTMIRRAMVAPAKPACGGFFSLLNKTDDEIFQLALSRKIGQCTIQDGTANPNVYCDYYVKSAVVGSLGMTGYPKNPTSGDSTGCVVAPTLPKGVSYCWGGYDSATMCTSNYKTNAANQIRKAIQNSGCCLSNNPTIPVSECPNPYLAYLSKTDQELFDMGTSSPSKLGKCYIADARNCSTCFCDYYVKSQIVIWAGQGYPVNPATGASTGCVVAPTLPKGVSNCWNGYDPATMCTADYVKNSANQLRSAISNAACGCD